jgi:hypothetical protein
MSCFFQILEMLHYQQKSVGNKASYLQFTSDKNKKKHKEYCYYYGHPKVHI